MNAKPGPIAARETQPRGNRAAAALLIAGAGLALTPWATPALALAAGLVVALTVGNPFPRATGVAGSRLLQLSVIGLGFGIPLADLIHAGGNGVLFTAVLISSVFAIGLTLAHGLDVARPVAVLITAGTSICGGSAIAALGPAIGAEREEMSVSLGTVFVLNAVALYVFPPIGHLVGLTEHQFGLWAALAIHDTSSVVGAAASYGPTALEVATVLKLARALWIIPLVLVVPWMLRRTTPRATEGDAMGLSAESAGATRGPIPWFIALFILAAIVRSASPADLAPTFDALSRAARVALVVTLYLIGTNLSRAQLKAVGARPFVLGVLLWIVVGVGSLAAIKWGVAV